MDDGLLTAELVGCPAWRTEEGGPDVSRSVVDQGEKPHLGLLGSDRLGHLGRHFD